MIKNLHHVCIAVKDVDATVKAYTAILGAEPIKVEKSEEPNLKMAYFQVGGSMLEFFEATPGSPFEEFVAARGEGLHHIAYEVQDIAGEIKKKAALGLCPPDTQAGDGPGGMKFAFIGPDGANGVLTELVELA